MALERQGTNRVLSMFGRRVQRGVCGFGARLKWESGTRCVWRRAICRWSCAPFSPWELREVCSRSFNGLWRHWLASYMRLDVLYGTCASSAVVEPQ